MSLAYSPLGGVSNTRVLKSLGTAPGWLVRPANGHTFGSFAVFYLGYLGIVFLKLILFHKYVRYVHGYEVRSLNEA